MMEAKSVTHKPVQIPMGSFTSATTLHALHYHQINVFALQEQMKAENFDGIDTILDIPLMEADRTLSGMKSNVN